MKDEFEKHFKDVSDEKADKKECDKRMGDWND